MSTPSPSLIGKDGLVGVAADHAAHGPFHIGFFPHLLDLACLSIYLAEARSACPVLDDGDQSPRWNSRRWRWRRRRRWWWFKLWWWGLGFLPSLYPGFPSCSIPCLASRATLTTTALFTRLLVRTSSYLVKCLRSSRARGWRGPKLKFQHSAHLAIHSLEGEAGTSAFSPDPGKGSIELV